MINNLINEADTQQNKLGRSWGSHGGHDLPCRGSDGLLANACPFLERLLPGEAMAVLPPEVAQLSAQSLFYDYL